MRPVCVFAKGPGSEIEQLRASLEGRWRQAARAVMVLLSLQGLSAAQIAELLECHPATVRRWIGRFNTEGLTGLADRPRPGRPPLSVTRLASRIAALLERPGPWTLPRIWRYLGRPRLSMRTLYRRVALVAIWRRPKLTARGDPDHDHVVAGIVARLIELPRTAVVCAEDETHLNLLPHVRASWTLRGRRPQVPTQGKNRQVAVLGALELTTGRWVYRLGRRRADDFIALLEMLTDAFPRAPAIVVICDNESIHHARAVTAYLEKNPRRALAGSRTLHLGSRRDIRADIVTVSTHPGVVIGLPAGRGSAPGGKLLSRQPAPFSRMRRRSARSRRPAARGTARRSAGRTVPRAVPGRNSQSCSGPWPATRTPGRGGSRRTGRAPAGPAGRRRGQRSDPAGSGW